MRSPFRLNRLQTGSPGRRRLRTVVSLLLFITVATEAWNVASSAEPTNPAEGFNLILISLTNTRADHLGFYGYNRETSPNLDRLARRSVVFRNAFTHASWTLPAVVSLFTSQYPFTHRLMNREQAEPLPASAVTFVDSLKTNGYATAAFVGGRDYAVKFGHTSRFGYVFDPVNDSNRDDWHAYGVLQNSLPKAREWLRRNREQKFALLLQAYDTHCPFAVPKANPKFDPNYTGQIDFTKCYWTFEKTRPARVRTQSGRYEEVYLLKTKPTEGDNYDVPFHPDDIRHMIALYDGEIFNADEQIGALLDDVKSLGLAEKTIIIFYADHGDMFGKHGRFMRGGPLRGTFYDDVLRIPLVIHHPRLGPRTVDELVQLLDLGPTILDLVGLAPVPGFRGKSLRPLVEGRSGGNDYVFAGSAFTPSAHNPFFQHESVIYSVRSKEWKLIFERIRFSVGPQETFELYDLKKDPEELEDVARTKPEVVTKLKQVLLEWLDDIKASEFRPQW